MTALTVYGCLSAATTLTTANLLVSVTGGGSTANNNNCNQSTGYSEIYSQGGNPWQALGSIGSPTGHGWLLDVTTLEGQQISAGNWTPSLRGQIQGGTGTVVADMYVRAYKRSSSGTYTQIGSNMVLASQTLQNATSNNYVFSATSQPVVNFGPGDKLYVDIWLNITTNLTTGTSAVRINQSISTTQGAANVMQVVTPGYISLGTNPVIYASSMAAGYVLSGGPV